MDEHSTDAFPPTQKNIGTVSATGRSTVANSSRLRRSSGFGQKSTCVKPGLDPGHIPVGWLPRGWDAGVEICVTREQCETGLADGTWEHAWRQGFADRLAHFGRLA